MIRTTHRRSFASIVAMLALAGLTTSLVTGCGFKGPLYLPPPKPAAPVSQAPKTPVPENVTTSSATKNTPAVNQTPTQ